MHTPHPGWIEKQIGIGCALAQFDRMGSYSWINDTCNLYSALWPQKYFFGIICELVFNSHLTLTLH